MREGGREGGRAGRKRDDKEERGRFATCGIRDRGLVLWSHPVTDMEQNPQCTQNRNVFVFRSATKRAPFFM